jgi:YgiT-type zinc finger domain-containing protein
MAEEDKVEMIPFDKCPVCGGEVIEKEVEKLLRGGNNTAIVKVKAEVCLHCGERLYSQETIKKFEEVRKRLEKKETEGYIPVGQSYIVG